MLYIQRLGWKKLFHPPSHFHPDPGWRMEGWDGPLFHPGMEDGGVGWNHLSIPGWRFEVGMDHFSIPGWRFDVGWNFVFVLKMTIEASSIYLLFIIP
jgi:hypothetical protein